MANAKDILKKNMSQQNYDKLVVLDNEKLFNFVADAIKLTNPASVFVCTDKPEDMQYIRELAIKTGEEKKLKTKGHTYHFDGYSDQGRDKSVTKYLLTKGSKLEPVLSHVEKSEGLNELNSFFKDSMVGREMIVCFFCLGPTNSEFSISCAQITDSPYVAHSESILYRWGYEQFKKVGTGSNFFRFMHTEGELEGGVSKNKEKRRIYIDVEDDIVYSVNTQYAGNTVGLKKLALRLTINKASKEGWLAEHMFVMGAHGPNGRITYFTGAFPSACGKTSTAMISGQTIIGDDIAYLRKIDGKIKCVNVEKGVFGIIQDVNPDNDPAIYKALTDPGEVIFSNVLIKDGKPYWLGMGQELPKDGVNHSGQWQAGNKDANGNEITASHKNARYTLNISELANRDPRIDDSEGVEVGGIIYGGRDSDTWVPIEQALNWTEGIISKGASIESETTAATLGKEGVRTFNIMANMDFLPLPMGKYIQNNLDFANDIENPAPIFSVNYFLRNKEGKYLNGILDKKVWILWAELRVNGDVDAIKTPTGWIPKYEDLVKLFKNNLKKDYTKESYEQQFTTRIQEQLAKIDRIEKI
ncbi:MAG TPA: phosphoenolpyruvate carboxykinase (GTP), partial [Sedimentisphaerales bacterium]|nr:phosphoenolpyruvate carboxykinase (GTP) [Sedimentisphaerales bacterium]